MLLLVWPVTAGLCLLLARTMASAELEAGSTSLIPAGSLEGVGPSDTTVNADLGSAGAPSEHATDG